MSAAGITVTGPGVVEVLAGGAIVLLYAWVEFPFANPAVMLTFCATFYCAVRYAALDVRDQETQPR